MPCREGKRGTFNGFKSKDVLITATGGVGSFAVMALSKMGYDVHAVTGKKENMNILRNLEQKIF